MARRPSTERVGSRAQLAALAALLAGACLVVKPAAVLADESQRVRVDGLAALVGGANPAAGVDVVLRSDVELRARLALAGQGAAVSVSPSASLLAATLDQLVSEVLIAREALRVQIAQPSASDVKRERQRIVLMAGGSARTTQLLALLGADDAELDAVAQRRALAAAFLSANLEGAMVVTDGEVEQRFRAEAENFAGRDANEVRDLLRARLAREALNRNIERWVRVLRARTPVRTLATFRES